MLTTGWLSNRAQCSLANFLIEHRAHWLISNQAQCSLADFLIQPDEVTFLAQEAQKHDEEKQQTEARAISTQSQRFRQGAQLGPWLLKKLRGEDVQPDVDEYLSQEAQKHDEETQEKLMQAALKANRDAAQEKKMKRQRYKRNEMSTEQRREAEQQTNTERRKRVRHEMAEEKKEAEREKQQQRMQRLREEKRKRKWPPVRCLASQRSEDRIQTESQDTDILTFYVRPSQFFCPSQFFWPSQFFEVSFVAFTHPQKNEILKYTLYNYYILYKVYFILYKIYCILYTIYFIKYTLCKYHILYHLYCII